MSIAQIDTTPVRITPIFHTKQVENLLESKKAGYAVYDTFDVVEIRIAGREKTLNYFPVEAESHKEDGVPVTYRERFKEQYNEWVNGGVNRAKGTPLERLKEYGDVTDQAISLCGTFNVYSIEALDSLSGPQLGKLGMHANTMKDAAKAYLAATSDKLDMLAEFEKMRARIAELEGGNREEGDKAHLAALRSEIEQITGQPLKGNFKLETLERQLAELKAA